MTTGLSILVRLRDGRYDAGGLVPSQPEWPPHPARLFCALVASVADETDREALAWLERAGFPEVWASEDYRVARSSGYVVLNSSAGTGSQTWPGRGSGTRQRASALPAEDTFTLVWPGATPDDGTLARLVRLAARVPYVGRSTSPAEVSLIPEVIASRPGWTRFIPVTLGHPGSVPVRVPYPGYLQALDEAYDDGVRAWHATARTIAYAPATDAAPQDGPAPVDAVYRDVLTWGLDERTVPIRGDDLLTLTVALRRAVLSRVTDPLPAQVSGHGADGRPHVAYLGLLDVGYRYSDGHLLGVAVAVPHEISTVDRRVLLRGLLGAGATDPLSELPYRGRRMALRYEPDRGLGLRPQRWGYASPTRTWVTATPLMLDRFPSRGSDVGDVLADSLATAGYPRPESAEMLPAPPVRGAIHRMRRGTVPCRPGRPIVHCRVTFAEPVAGPVVAGALRYLGAGLFVPEVDDGDR